MGDCEFFEDFMVQTCSSQSQGASVGAVYTCQMPVFLNFASLNKSVYDQHILFPKTTPFHFILCISNVYVTCINVGPFLLLLKPFWTLLLIHTLNLRDEMLVLNVIFG